MRVCASCGLVAPLVTPACAGCGSELGSGSLEAEGGTPTARWAQVRCDIECRVCGRRAPQNHVDADGVIGCALCSTEQAFDATAWRALFDEAHAIVDLSAPAPEPVEAAAEHAGEAPRGRRRRDRFAEENPYRDVRVRSADRAWEQARSGTKNPLRARIGPGHPLCGRCRGPLSIASPEPRVLVTACSSCDEQATYASPAPLAALCPELVGLIAPEHRTDHPSVAGRPSRDGGAVPIQCPSCGAGLTLEGRPHLVTCAYCKTTARIPAKLLREAAGEPRIEPFWALLRGPSKARVAIERRLEAEREQAKRAEANARWGAAVQERVSAHQERERAVGAVALRAVKWRAALFSVAAVAAMGIYVATFFHVGEQNAPVWFSGPFFIVSSLMFFGTIFGQVIFGVPLSKTQKQWEPCSEREQRVTLVIAGVVLAGVVVMAAALWGTAPVKGAGHEAPRGRGAAPARR